MDATGYFIVITAVGVVAAILAAPRASTRTRAAQEEGEQELPA